MYSFSGKLFMERVKETLNCKTQVDITEITGINKDKLSAINSHDKYPDLCDLINIASKGNCSIDWLLGFDHESSNAENKCDPSVYDFFEMLVLMRKYGLICFEENKVVLTKSLFLPAFYKELRAFDIATADMEEDLKDKIFHTWLASLKQNGYSDISLSYGIDPRT